MAMLQCEVCGGKLVGKPGGIFECEYCGLQYDSAWAKAKIQEIKGTVQVEGTVEVTGTVKVEGSANIESLLKRGKLALEDGNFTEAKTCFDKVLDIAPECAEAYLGLAMADFNTRKENELVFAPKLKNKNYLRAKQYADKELLDKLSALEEESKNMLVASRIRNHKVRNMIAAGYDIVGLKSNGNVIHYRNGLFWADIVAIAAESNHTVGLKLDGTVVAVGKNEDGRCNVSEWRNIVAIAAGSYHTVGLKSDGTVVAVGSNSSDQCNVSGWRNIVAVSAGYGYTVGLKSDGTVVAVGSNSFDQCNVSEWEGIIAVSAGNWHTVGLKSDGTVVAVGRNMEGQCNISEWGNIVAVSAGNVHTLGLKLDGTVAAVGYNGDGACNVSEWKNIVALAAERYSFALKSDGTIDCAGYRPFLPYDAPLPISEWKLFDDLDNIEEERTDLRKADAAMRRGESVLKKKESVLMKNSKSVNLPEKRSVLPEKRSVLKNKKPTTVRKVSVSTAEAPSRVCSKKFVQAAAKKRIIDKRGKNLWQCYNVRFAAVSS